MKRLVVHIGMQKTGSSSIQRMLVKETKRLAGLGVHVAAAGRPKGAMGHHNLPLDVARDRRFRPADGSMDDLREEIAAAGAETVIISSERFDSVPREKAVYRRLARFAHSLSRELVILAFVRDHVSALNSRYTQNVKTFRHAMPFEEYVEKQLGQPYWSLRRLFIGYERVADRMIVLPYDGDVLAAFCRELGVTIDAGRHQRRNVSVGPRTIEACRVLVRNKGVPGGPVHDGPRAPPAVLEALGLRHIAARLGWDAVPYWGFTPRLADRTWRRLMPPDQEFLDRYAIAFDRSKLDRERNDITLADMSPAERTEFMQVLAGLAGPPADRKG